MKKKALIQITLFLVLLLVLTGCATPKAGSVAWWQEHYQSKVLVVTPTHFFSDAPQVIVKREDATPSWWQAFWAKITGKKLRTPEIKYDVYN